MRKDLGINNKRRSQGTIIVQYKNCKGSKSRGLIGLECALHSSITAQTHVRIFECEYNSYFK